MAMVKHGSSVPWVEFIATSISRQYRDFRRDRHSVVTLTGDINKAMIRTMQVQGVRHIVRVFQSDRDFVALLDANRR